VCVYHFTCTYPILQYSCTLLHYKAMYIKAMKMTTIDDDRQSRRRLSGVGSTTNKPRRHIISQEDTAQETTDVIATKEQMVPRHNRSTLVLGQVNHALHYLYCICTHTKHTWQWCLTVAVEQVDYDETLLPPLSPPYQGWNEQRTVDHGWAHHKIHNNINQSIKGWINTFRYNKIIQLNDI